MSHLTEVEEAIIRLGTTRFVLLADADGRVALGERALDGRGFVFIRMLNVKFSPRFPNDLNTTFEVDGFELYCFRWMLP